jgi:hypothetical protein
VTGCSLNASVYLISIIHQRSIHIHSSIQTVYNASNQQLPEITDMRTLFTLTGKSEMYSYTIRLLHLVECLFKNLYLISWWIYLSLSIQDVGTTIGTAARMPYGQQMNLVFKMNFVVLWDTRSCQLQTVTYFPKAQQFYKTPVIVFQSTRLNSQKASIFSSRAASVSNLARSSPKRPDWL